MYLSVVYRLGQSMFIITILLYGHFVDTVTQEEFLHTVHASNKKLTFRSVSTIV